MSARGQSFRPVRVSLPDKRAARYVAAARAACTAVTPPCPSGQEEPGRAASRWRARMLAANGRADPAAEDDRRASQVPSCPHGRLRRDPPQQHQEPPPARWSGCRVVMVRRPGQPRLLGQAIPGRPTAAGRRAGPSSGTHGQTSLVPPFGQLLRARMRLGPGLPNPEGPTDRLIHQTAAQAWRRPRTQARIRRFGCLAARPANPRIRVPQEYGLTPTAWQDIAQRHRHADASDGGQLYEKAIRNSPFEHRRVGRTISHMPDGA